MMPKNLPDHHWGKEAPVHQSSRPVQRSTSFAVRAQRLLSPCHHLSRTSLAATPAMVHDPHAYVAAGEVNLTTHLLLLLLSYCASLLFYEDTNFFRAGIRGLAFIVSMENSSIVDERGSSKNKDPY